jgi:lysozyme
MISQTAIDLAKDFIRKVEGLRLTPYFDSASHLSNGYGNTYNIPHGAITLDQAEADLNINVLNACKELCLKLSPLPLLKLEDHEIAALIAFVFNVGAGNWRIWKIINQLKLKLVPTELMRFDHARVSGKLVEIKGLTNRRRAEVALWDTGEPGFASLSVTSNKEAVASNAMKVEPKPDPILQVKANQGSTSVVTITAAAAAVVAGHKYGISPHLLYAIVGFSLGCVVILAVAIYCYYRNTKLVRHINSLKPEDYFIVNPQPKPKIEMDIEMASAAFNTALAALVAAYEAKVASAQAEVTSAVAAVQTQLDAANTQITTLRDELTAADADDTAAVVAATPAA